MSDSEDVLRELTRQVAAAVAAGDVAPALQTLRSHLEDHPSDRTALAMLVRTQAWAEGPDAALAHLDAAAPSKDDDPDLSPVRLELLVAAGRYAQAIALGARLLGKPTTRSPESAGSLLDALELAGRRGHALRLLEFLACEPAMLGLVESRRASILAMPSGSPAAESRTAAQRAHRQVTGLTIPSGHADFARAAALIGGNPAVHARQVRFHDGRYGYLPVHSPLTAQRWEQHTAGRSTLGFYLLDQEGRSRTLILDLDVAHGHVQSYLSSPQVHARLEAMMRERVLRLVEIARGAGLRLHPEASGCKGYHLWAFFEPLDAGTVRALGRLLLARLAAEVPELSWEVFPKQDRLPRGGLGNLVKLPWGVHQRTGSRSFFLDPTTLDPLPDQAEWLTECVPHGAAEIEQAITLLSTPAELSEVDALVESGKRRMAADGEETSVTPATAGEPICDKVSLSYPAKLPVAVDAVLSGCGALREIVAKARLGRVLGIKERHVLVHVFAHLGQDAHLFVHQVLAQAEGYDPARVRRDLRAVSPQAIGCARIRQLLPQLHQATDCACPSGLPANAYPSPLVHAGIVCTSNWIVPQEDRPSSESAQGALLAAVAPRIRAARSARELAVLAELLADQRRRLERELSGGATRASDSGAGGPMPQLRVVRPAPEEPTATGSGPDTQNGVAGVLDAPRGAKTEGPA